ncbi:LCP family protein [Candidatus Saccharibacteria bacterium]|nr:LCP family protein [Candidatus Saccharibacteria bacterium]
MKRQNTSIDGFIPRRSKSKPINAGDSPKKVGRPNKDIEDSLNAINLTDVDEPQNKRRRRHKKAHKAKGSRLGRFFKRFMLLIGVVLLAFVGYLAYRAIHDTGNIFEGGLFGLMHHTALKTDANGRTNIVIFGTAEDGSFGAHDGANLTDSIMVLSIYGKGNTASMISLPRDLWVQYDQACVAGYQGKLNAVYFCASDDGANEKVGAQALKSKIKEVTGIDIQYYAHLNFASVIAAVDAIGGVDVKIESDDPRGIYDVATGVNYKNGEVVHLNGDRALALARARNSEGGYGLANSNFDREKNQQKILKALFSKATKLNLATDIGKALGLMQVMGNNLHTDINTSEVRAFADIAKGLKLDDINSISMYDQDNPLLATGPIDGQSAVYPTAGNLDFSGIRAFLKQQLSTDPVVKEAAKVDIYNGSDIDGLAQSMADELTGLGLVAGNVASTNEQISGNIAIYQLNTKKTATRQKLEEYYKTQVKPAKSLPASFTNRQADFIIVVSSKKALHG